MVIEDESLKTLPAVVEQGWDEAEALQDTGLLRNPTTGQFLPGHSGNPHGRPAKGQTYADLAAKLASTTKRRVVKAMVQQAVKEGSVKAAEWLRDTAEGKPAVRVVHEESPALAALLGQWAAIDAEFEVKDDS